MAWRYKTGRKKACVVTKLLLFQPNAFDFSLLLGIPQDLIRQVLIKCGWNDPQRNCNFTGSVEWLWNVMSHINVRMEKKGIGKEDAEDIISI
jgi:hypothetical protein